MSANSDGKETYFLPVERAGQALVIRQGEQIAALSPYREMLDLVSDAVVILNHERQIVYANEAFRRLAVNVGDTPLIGQRVGEALNCIHAADLGGGCGTSEFCTTCGAARAIASAGKGVRKVKECQIERAADNVRQALDLRVTATPQTNDGVPFTIFMAQDVSHEKRRQQLERLFFHDISNTATNIRGLAELLELGTDFSRSNEKALRRNLYRAAGRLLEEILAQRQLLAAERGDLQLEQLALDSLPLLEELIAQYEGHELAQRELRLDDAAENVVFVSDPTLLGRILSNMLKNALEAAKPGEAIRLGCRAEGGDVAFWVHNRGCMRRHIQLQIFRRSFSTKGSNRGLGTYSMKLLGEDYLGGKVSFTSSREGGTTFSIRLPLSGA